MKLVIQWYDRKPNFDADYSKEHHGTFYGSSADDCMKQYNEWRQNHDICRFTRSEIIYIYD